MVGLQLANLHQQLSFILFSSNVVCLIEMYDRIHETQNKAHYYGLEISP